MRPYAAGGEATIDNVQLRCRAHNLYEADLYFGLGDLAGVRETRAAYSVRTEFSRREPRIARGNYGLKWDTMRCFDDSRH